jgi:hypothetical protein
MQRILTTLLIVILVSSCSSSTVFLKGPRVHNYAIEFIKHYETIKSFPISKQVQLTKKDFFSRFPTFYDYKINKWKKEDKDPDKQIEQFLTEYPSYKETFIKKTNEITTNLDSSLASFIREFPELDRNFEIYITHSFGEMDGGTRKINGELYFIFGIDGMTKYHKGFKSELPFFHHELFHIYHTQYISKDDEIFVPLWAEGLATDASEKLNPKTSPMDLMLDIPEGMIEAINEDRKYHWNKLLSKIDSTGEEDYEMFFLFSSKDKRLVKRSGYYLGYLLAKEIGKDMTISEMAQLEKAKLRELIIKNIANLSK